MKPAPFRYVAARSLGEALDLVAEHGPDAKLLAGGQSLVPMMNFRLVRPAWLIDLNRLQTLAAIGPDDGGLVVGAMTRQVDAERSPLVRERAPLLAEALPWIGHAAIRNRGTVGGSLAHADPAAELAVAAVALDARLRLQSRRGLREVAADDFFVSLLTTTLEADEILTEVAVPPWDARWGWAFVEFARRHGDFALAAVAVVTAVSDGGFVEPVRVVLGGLGNRPIRARRAEQALRGGRPTAETLEAAAVAAGEEVDPPSDLHGSAEYRRHLAQVFTRRALDIAVARATGGDPPAGRGDR